MKKNVKSFKNIYKTGKIGTWKKWFKGEMSIRIDKIVEEKLLYKKPFKYEPSSSAPS
jgi:hypothetical protein